MKNTLRLLASIIVFTCFSNSLYAQAGNEEASVKEVVTRLFKAMELGDSAMLRSAFHNHVTLGTIVKDKSGNTVLRPESSINEFAKAVGTPHKEVWHEDIWNVKVQLDGDFAQVW